MEKDTSTPGHQRDPSQEGGPDTQGVRKSTSSGRDEEIVGSYVRPFLWAALLFYAGFAIVLGWVDWANSSWPLMTLVTLNVVGLTIATYIALLANMPVAYSMTLKDVGVLIWYRNALMPLWRGRDSRCFPWDELRNPEVKMGSVSVRSNDPYHWIVLSYEQARVLLTDGRCPLRGKVPNPVAKRLGIPLSKE